MRKEENIMFRNLETTVCGLDIFSGQVFGHTNQTTDNFSHVFHDISLLLRLWWQNRAAIECVFFPIRLLLFLCCDEHTVEGGSLKPDDDENTK